MTHTRHNREHSSMVSDWKPWQYRLQSHFCRTVLMTLMSLHSTASIACLCWRLRLMSAHTFWFALFMELWFWPPVVTSLRPQCGSHSVIHSRNLELNSHDSIRLLKRVFESISLICNRLIIINLIIHVSSIMAGGVYHYNEHEQMQPRPQPAAAAWCRSPTHTHTQHAHTHISLYIIIGLYDGNGLLPRAPWTVLQSHLKETVCPLGRELITVKTTACPL